jgi:hypothetical protein
MDLVNTGDVHKFISSFFGEQLNTHVFHNSLLLLTDMLTLALRSGQDKFLIIQFLCPITRRLQSLYRLFRRPKEEYANQLPLV